MEKNYLLKSKWDKFVGRRQPPLRGYLIYQGFIDWLSKRYDYDFSNLFLFFCEKIETDAIADSFVNYVLKEKLINLIIDDINVRTKKLHDDIDRFKEDTSKLFDFSKNLSKSNEEFNTLFKKFCELWKNFAPSLVFIIFMEEALEREVLKNFEDKEEAKLKLMNIVASDVKSHIFDDLNKRTDAQYNEFYLEYEKHTELLKKLIQFRDWRKNIYDSSWYGYSKDFFEKLGSSTGIGPNIDWESPETIIKFLKNKNKYEFENHALVFYDNKLKKININYGEDVFELKNKVLSSVIGSEIKGNIACKGFAKGIVRIIEPHTKVKTFNDGDILVSKMTTPDLTPIIKKAGGIVTDEGGVTSHAAVLSREFDIPCVIGTKFATKVLKDGDIVEVDANKGVVKKLK